MNIYEQFMAQSEILHKLIESHNREIEEYYVGKKVKLVEEIIEEFEIEDDIWTISSVSVFDDVVFFDIETTGDDLQDLEIGDLIFL